jgi:hypothetical protein
VVVAPFPSSGSGDGELLPNGFSRELGPLVGAQSDAVVAGRVSSSGVDEEETVHQRLGFDGNGGDLRRRDEISAVRPDLDQMGSSRAGLWLSSGRC